MLKIILHRTSRACHNFTQFCTFLVPKFAARFARNSSMYTVCTFIKLILKHCTCENLSLQESLTKKKYSRNSEKGQKNMGVSKSGALIGQFSKHKKIISDGMYTYTVPRLYRMCTVLCILVL